MDDSAQKQPNKAVIAIVVVVLLAIVAAAVILLGKKDTNANSANTTQPDVAQGPASSSETAPSTASSTPSSTYKDGSYDATSNYQTPGGIEAISVKVTLASSIIKDISVDANPTTSDAREYQGRFLSGYKALVVGKNIDTVTLSRVAGSSLTSGGFNSALDTVKSNAKA